MSDIQIIKHGSFADCCPECRCVECLESADGSKTCTRCGCVWRRGLNYNLSHPFDRDISDRKDQA